MNKKIKTICITLWFIALSIIIGFGITKVVRTIIKNEQTLCNPICYPHSYNTQNLNCKCNHKE